MMQSHVVDIGGVFVGAAIREEAAIRFVAVDPRVEELDQSLWPDMPAMERGVRYLLTTGRVPAERAPSGAAQ